MPLTECMASKVQPISSQDCVDFVFIAALFKTFFNRSASVLLWTVAHSNHPKHIGELEVLSLGK